MARSSDKTRAPQPVSVPDALSSDRMNLHVSAGQKLVLNHLAEDVSSCYHIARLNAFDDLKRLRLVPEFLDDASTLAAIRADDQMATELMQQKRSNDHASEECSCAGQGKFVGPRSANFEQTVHRQAYQRVRRSVHHNLIAILQTKTKARLDWTHPLVGLTYYHVGRWLKFADRGLAVGLFNLNDINIEDHGTLTIEPTTQVLIANNITLGSEARLQFLGTNITANCDTLNGPWLTHRAIPATQVVARVPGWEIGEIVGGGK